MFRRDRRDLDLAPPSRDDARLEALRRFWRGNPYALDPPTAGKEDKVASLGFVPRRQRRAGTVDEPAEEVIDRVTVQRSDFRSSGHFPAGKADRVTHREEIR